MKNVVHVSLEGGYNVCEPKGHNAIRKIAPWCGESGLKLICMVNFYIMVT